MILESTRFKSVRRLIHPQNVADIQAHIENGNVFFIVMGNDDSESVEIALPEEVENVIGTNAKVYIAKWREVYRHLTKK